MNYHSRHTLNCWKIERINIEPYDRVATLIGGAIVGIGAAKQHVHVMENMMNMHKGFSLIELMIVVAVIAILASYGIPAYNDYVTRGKLIQATSGLSDGRIKMEQYFQDNRTYMPSGAFVPPCPPATQYFTFDCTTTAPTATTYRIVATGKGNLAAYTYTIDQANGKTSTTPLTDPPNSQVACWIMKPGDRC